MAYIPKPWEDFAKDLKRLNTRWRIQKRDDSPFINVRDAKTRKRYSCQPLLHSNEGDIQKVVDTIISTGDKEWTGIKEESEQVTKSSVPTWVEIINLCNKDWPLRVKDSTRKTWNCELNNLLKDDIPRDFESLENWVREKWITGNNPTQIGKKAVEHRLDTLVQINKTLTSFDPKEIEPSWLPKSKISQLRKTHNNSLNSKILGSKDGGVNIRGIPEKDKFFIYLKDLFDKYPLEQWCLAMLLVYGLRPHELWWVSPISKENKKEGCKYGWVYVPGEHRTKSKHGHWVFPLYESWIVEFGLQTRFQECQERLHKRVPPRIVSKLDPTKLWKPGNPKDEGYQMNNGKLGQWFSDRICKGSIPRFKASIPDKNGKYHSGYEEKNIVPYDLRHTWAITVHTSERFNHVDIAKAADCMGHDVVTHRKHYLKWVGEEQDRKRAMSLKIPREIETKMKKK